MLTIGADGLEATFEPEVGMLGTSLRFRGEELLDLSGGVARLREQGHQTGLPLLAPWANRLGGWRYEIDGVEVDLDGLDLGTDPNGLPIHGTMTAQRGWEVRASSASALRARFDYGAHADLLAVFPFPHDLTIDVAVETGALHASTTVVPTGDRAVPVCFGWHPYLRLPGTAAARLAAGAAPLRAPRARRPQPADRRVRARSPPRRTRSATARSTTCTPWATTVSSRSKVAASGSPSPARRATPSPRCSRRRMPGSCVSSR